MKKLLALLLALVMCVSMFACGGEEEKDSKKDDKDNEEIAELKDDIKALEDEIAELEEELEDADDDDKEELEEKIKKLEEDLEEKEDELKKLESDDEDEDEDEDEDKDDKKDKDEDEDEKDDDEFDFDAPCKTFDEAVEKLEYQLDVMSGGTIEEFAEITGGNVEDLDNPISYATVEAVLKNFSYEMGDAEKSGDTGTVELTITNIDLNEVLSQYYGIVENGNYTTEEEATELLLKMLTADNPPTFTEEVVVNFVKVEGEWRPDEDNNADYERVVTGMSADVE